MKNALTSLIVIFIIIIGTATFANSSQIINYQGYLTDSDGEPVADSEYQITFTIYDGGGVSWWTSGERDIPIYNGLFSHNLGSAIPIPDSIFGIGDLYLGIKIGDDPEISPKTLLTSSPKAAVAANLFWGSLESTDGELVLKNTNGDSAMVFIAGFDSHLFRIHPPDPCVPPEPCSPAIELYANNENRVSIYSTDVTDGREMITMQNSPTEGTSLVGFNPQPEPPGIPAFELGMNSAKDSPGSYFRMYNPVSEYLDEPLISMTSSPSEGGMLTFYDQMPPPDNSRELMTIGHTTTEGIGIVGFNPQPEPPGMIAFEMLTGDGAKGPGGRIAVYNSDSVRTSFEGGMLELRDLTTAGRPNTIMEIRSGYSQFNMFGVTPAVGEPPAITMIVDDDSAKVGIGTSDPAEALHVVGNITLTGEMYIYTDTKLKTNIRPITNPIEKIHLLNGVSYNYRYNEYPRLKLAENDQIGLLAEDVEKVLPEIVHSDKDGNKLVAYSKITPLLIEAIKE
ncbi:MAG: tail fiber domain-containing protein, partial [Candidatus Zixiibacteriota bacterium]